MRTAVAQNESQQLLNHPSDQKDCGKELLLGLSCTKSTSIGGTTKSSTSNWDKILDSGFCQGLGKCLHTNMSAHNLTTPSKVLKSRSQQGAKTEHPKVQHSPWKGSTMDCQPEFQVRPVFVTNQDTQRQHGRWRSCEHKVSIVKDFVQLQYNWSFTVDNENQFHRNHLSFKGLRAQS